MTLFDCNVGDVFTVSQIRLEETLRHRLQILGILPGGRLQVLHKKRCGTMVVRTMGVRFAVGAGAARRIAGERTP